jgi:hypothetical protein
MKRLFTFLFVIMVLLSCSKEEETTSGNPYDDPSLKAPEDTNQVIPLDSGSFQYLYARVFKPTCSNSGCHDGNFEPDFRTVYSSYNSMVNHLGISNDANNSYTYRVEPGNSSSSLLWARLTIDIPNTSGMMPAVVDTGSDWNENKTVYLQMIKDWIDNGAPDTYGNKPNDANLQPQVTGIMVFPAGNTSNPFPRVGGAQNPISIGNSQVDVWMSFSDDLSDPADFKLTMLKSSYDLYDYTAAKEYTLSKATSISGNDFYGNTATFTHKTSVEFPTDTVGTYIYLRALLQDESQQDTTQMPSNGTNDIIRSYFTLKIDSL